MTDVEALARLLIERDGQNFDGEVHLTSEEGRQIVTELRNLSTRVAAVEAERDAMREALDEIARQKLSSELPNEAWMQADWQGGYDACVHAARRARAAIGEK